MKEYDLTSLQKADLFEKFKIQAYRDFELSGLSKYLPIMVSNHLEHLKSAFLNSVLQLELSNALKILLYRIDITELQLKKAIQQQPDKLFQELIAELMIKRILQKVILKERYS